jgi:hypothetical protein
MTEPHASAPILDCSAVDPAVVAGLQQLSAAYWLCADHAAAGIETLFTENGLLTLGTLALTGRTAIREFFEQRELRMRSAGRTTRHAACTLLVTPTAEGHATVRSTVLVFSGIGTLPLPAAAPSGIADFTDVCVRNVAGRWQFASRIGRTVFIGAEAPSFAR